MHFLLLSDLRLRIRIHTGEKLFVCAVFGFKRHMRIHIKEKPHKCSKCEKGFTRPGRLKRPIYDTHDRMKFKLYVMCGKGFSQLQNLKRKMLTHTKKSCIVASYVAKSFQYHLLLKSVRKITVSGCSISTALYAVKISDYMKRLDAKNN
uniref:C2H2-type domain-containing protein n=1 Tax=Onchocerca volvulus TaxID=6282 RepID=A0A8R1XPL9_ONCVO